MKYFEDLSHPLTSGNPIAAGAYIGYMDECENRYLLDKVIAAARNYPSEEISLEKACQLAGVSYKSLTPADIKYILEHFN